MRPRRSRSEKNKLPPQIKKCSCARTTTTYRSAAMRPVKIIKGNPACPKCKGRGLTGPCSACQGAGLNAGSTMIKPIQCESCGGTGRVPWGEYDSTVSSCGSEL